MLSTTLSRFDSLSRFSDASLTTQGSAVRSPGSLSGLNDPIGQTGSLLNSGFLSASSALTGTLSANDPTNPTRLNTYRDDYLLTGVTGGQQVQINMNSSFDNYLQLINADTGVVIASNDDTNGLNAQLNFTAQVNTRYLLRATSFDSLITGNYTLNTSVGNLTAATPLSGSLSVSGVLESSDPGNLLRSGTYYDGYLLTGFSAGQRVQVNMTSGFDNYLQLVNADTGQIITSNDDFNGLNAQISFIVQAGVNYVLQATSFGAGVTGAYTLDSSFLSPIDGTLSANDLSNPTRLNTYRDDYLLTGVTAGQQVQVNMNSDFDNYLQLINADTGAVIDFNDDTNGLNAQLNFTAQAGTRYIVRSTSFGSNRTGNYSLGTSVGGLTAATPLNLNQSFTGALENTDPGNSLRSGTYYDGYLLTGFSAGQVVRVGMTSSFDNYLQLVNAETGQIITFNDDSNGFNAQITFAAQAGINYLLRATSYSADTTGSYVISMV